MEEKTLGCNGSIELKPRHPHFAWDKNSGHTTKEIPPKWWILRSDLRSSLCRLSICGDISRSLLGVQRGLPFPAAEGPPRVHPSHNLHPQNHRRQTGMRNPEIWIQRSMSANVIAIATLDARPSKWHLILRFGKDDERSCSWAERQQLWGRGGEGRATEGSWWERSRLQPGKRSTVVFA